jgi:Helix-turn-helix domain
MRDRGFEPLTPTVSRVGSKEDCHTRNVTPPKARFINPHRLFHGVWLPHWLEERPEISEKSKKLYAYLTYFAGSKGYAWPSFNHLAEKLHVSRRYVITLVQELSAHRLITVTHVDNPAKGYCTNHYRFLWHPWMQTAEDRDFRLVVREEQASFSTAESALSLTSPGEPQITTPGEQEFTSPSELEDTSPGEPQITPLVIPSSPKENNKKRISIRGKVPATSSSTSPSKTSSAASPAPKVLSDTTKIILERRIGQLRIEIAAASKQDNPRAEQLHGELTAHQAALGFTPDDPPPKPKAPRKEESRDSTAFSDWPSPEEVTSTFNELRRSLGWPIKR